MADLNRRYEKCEQDLEQFRSEVADMTKFVKELFAQVSDVLDKVEVYHRQMYAGLQARTDAGFARLQACIDALPLSLSERKDEEPPTKLN
jgi:hypothetical protein